MRKDVPAPEGCENIREQVRTDPTKFREFKADRAAVERLRFFFEDRIVTAQGLSTLIDGIEDTLVRKCEKNMLLKASIYSMSTGRNCKPELNQCSL
jgi:hypothetical protein